MEKDTPENLDEYSAFLDSATAEDQLKTEVEIKANELEVRFRETLRDLGYESLPTEMNTRDAWTEYLVENAEDSDDMKRAKVEELDIRAILTVWGMMEMALNPELSDLERIASQRTMKVRLYTFLLEDPRYRPDSPIIQATNILLPGEVVHLEDDDVVAAILALHETQDDSTRPEIDTMVSEAYSATDVGIYEDFETAEKMADDILKIVNLVYIHSLLQDASDESWHAQRESMVRERALKYGLPNRYTDQLVTYFKSHDD